jgi:hypothetical protein
VFDPASSRVENLDKARATGFELAILRHGIWLSRQTASVAGDRR